MRAHFKKQTPLVISYRDYTNYDHSLFRYELIGNLNNLICSSSYIKSSCPIREKVCEGQ